MDELELPLVVDIWEDALPPPIDAANIPSQKALSSVDAAIGEVCAIIAEEFDPRQIVLFGSRARGDHRPSSDVDLLVVFDRIVRKRTLAAAIDDRLASLPLARDVIISTPEEIRAECSVPGSLLGAAVRDGKILYERGCTDAEGARVVPLRAG